jgi:uncharacterized surface protein with fasciclin (FAS1) repeats
LPTKKPTRKHTPTPTYPPTEEPSEAPAEPPVQSEDRKKEIIKAANGDNLRTGVTRRPTRVLINEDARVTKADVLAKDGVIHFFDEVLIPPGNLLDTIKGERNLSTLAAAVKAAKLESTLRDMKSDLTIFAPTNKAFQKLGDSAVNGLIKNPEKLKSILLYHAVSGSVLRSALRGEFEENESMIDKR